MKYAIIAGTGFEKVQELNESHIVKTPYGKVKVYLGRIKETEYFYIPRHGENHTIAPHKINYRANAYALKELDVDITFSLCAVGSVKEELPPGSLLLIKDIIDRTKLRESTFYDGEKLPLKHLDVSNIYCKNLREKLKTSFQTCTSLNLKEGVYVCTEGPRFETAAEIKEFALIGGDVVGMTNAPEIFLFAEMGFYSATIAYVTNYCTGITNEKVEMIDTYRVMDRDIKKSIENTILSLENLDELGERSIFI